MTQGVIVDYASGGAKACPAADEEEADWLRRQQEWGRMTLQATVFYRWQKESLENGAAAFEQKARPNHSADQKRIA
jgi:hypothetical protein